MEKIIFSKKEQKSVLKALSWRLDECDCILSDSSISDEEFMRVLVLRNYWCGIIRKLKLIFNS